MSLGLKDWIKCLLGMVNRICAILQRGAKTKIILDN